MAFQLNIITPAGSFFQDTVDAVVVPGEAGLFTVMTNHAALVAALQAGIIKVTQPGKETLFTIDSGVLEVDAGHQCLILADQIQPKVS
jgi:F-type H+-transporting ATPase subunit epsilon